MTETKEKPHSTGVLRVLTLDGGGAKGFYTLGVLKEIEAMVGCPLHQKFDLVFGKGRQCSVCGRSLVVAHITVSDPLRSVSYPASIGFSDRYPRYC